MIRILPYRVIALLIPFFVLSIHLALMYASLSSDQFLIMIGLMVVYILPPAGKETVIPLGIAIGLPWWCMALSIAMFDVETGLFMALNFDLAYKIPFLGPILVNLTQKTQRVIDSHRWFAGLYFFAIMLFVMVPGFGSGGFRSAIAGRLLGMETYLVVLAILAGALTGCFIIALGSEAIIGYFCSNGWLPGDIGAVICNRL